MLRPKRYVLQLRSRTLVLGERTLLMGVLNVTPDSFSDGGLYFDANAAIARALDMERAGADILDVGGESTRPGAEPTDVDDELARVAPVIDALRGKLQIPISIDTQKHEVAEAAIAAGAEIVNDVSALNADPAMAEVVRTNRVPLILMHMRGRPRTMHKGPFARDAVRDVITGLRKAMQRALKARIAKNQLLIDPGIGFGKKYGQNFELLNHLPELARLGCPLVVGTSRKVFIGRALAEGGDPQPATQRLWGTAATVTAAVMGGAHIVRVHDVAEMRDVVRVADALVRAR